MIESNPMGIQRFGNIGQPYVPPIKSTGVKSAPETTPSSSDFDGLPNLRMNLPEAQRLPITRLSEQLQPLGIPAASIPKLARQMQETNDQLYHAGRLLNGKAYVITTQDKVYYGWPYALKPQTVTHMTMNRCINEQIRDYTTSNGMRFRVTTRNQHRTANVYPAWLGQHSLPIPNIKQTSLPPEGASKEFLA